MHRVLLLLLLALSKVAASPILVSRDGVDNGIYKDSTFSLSQSDLASVSLICPNGTQQKANKNILFIHGTGGTGEESFGGGMLDAMYAKGYNGCYINLPNRALGDAQENGERVAYAIQQLYAKVGNQTIFMFGHSQGNLNIQWVLNYWPSTRKMVTSYVSLGGDFHGTSLFSFLSGVQTLFTKGAPPAVIQQAASDSKSSNFLKAINKRGNMALVPTTSLYGNQDEIVLPVVDSTNLAGSGAAYTHNAVQDVCPWKWVDHFGILINPVAFYMALDAFDNKSAASSARVKANYPQICSLSTAPGVSDTAIPDTYQSAFREIIANVGAGVGTDGGAYSITTKVEPTLKSYALQ